MGDASSSEQEGFDSLPDVIEALRQLMIVVEHVQLDVRPRGGPGLNRGGIDGRVAPPRADGCFHQFREGPVEETEMLVLARALRRDERHVVIGETVEEHGVRILGQARQRSPTGGGGKATFYERGEYLKVEDTNSNGWRVVAQITWCDGPFWTVSPLRGWLDRDSGPNEGAVDRETYDFDFAEGRRLVFRVCEKKISTGAIRNCSGNEMVWA
jgi:hypothetical protein